MGLAKTGRIGLLGVTLVALLGSISIAGAQQRKKIVIEEAEQVEGTVQKPQVTYIVTRQDIEDEEQLKLDKSFVPKIVASVEKEPF
jgi:hypothetical protein